LTVLMSQVMILACIADVWRSLEAIADGFPPTRWLHSYRSGTRRPMVGASPAASLAFRMR
jgi:hypothetical protein